MDAGAQDKPNAQNHARRLIEWIAILTAILVGLTGLINASKGFADELRSIAPTLVNTLRFNERCSDLNGDEFLECFLRTGENADAP